MSDFLNYLIEPNAQDVADAIEAQRAEQDIFEQEQATLFLRDQHKDDQEVIADSRDRYDIVRQYQDTNKRSRVILRGLTLQEAQAHCSNPETSSRTCTSSKSKAITRRNGQWFDAYQISKKGV